MYYYIIKRLFLMIPTLLGVLLLTFAVVQFVPGGPVEQLANQLTDINVSGEASSGSSNIYRGSSGLSEEHLNDLKVLLVYHQISFCLEDNFF